MSNLCLSIFLAAAPAANAATGDGNATIGDLSPQTTVVATVNGELIYRSDVDKLSPPMKSDNALSLLVDFKLLDQAAKKHHLTVPGAELARMRASLVSARHATSYDKAAGSLNESTYGLDQQLLHARLLEELSALELPKMPEDIVHAMGILVRTGGPHASTDAAARRTAASLIQDIEKGSGFRVLAKKDSDDPVSCATDGDLGIVQDSMPHIVQFGPDNRLTQNLIHRTTIGLIDHPVPGDHGYWVVKIVSTLHRPGMDGSGYAAARSFWGYYWVNKLEPGVMQRLRESSVIQPPLMAAAK